MRHYALINTRIFMGSCAFP